MEAIRNELGLDGKTVIGISWKSIKTKYKTESIDCVISSAYFQVWMLFLLIFSMVMLMRR